MKKELIKPIIAYILAWLIAGSYIWYEIKQKQNKTKQNNNEKNLIISKRTTKR